VGPARSIEVQERGVGPARSIEVQERGVGPARSIEVQQRGVGIARLIEVQQRDVGIGHAVEVQQRGVGIGQAVEVQQSGVGSRLQPRDQSGGHRQAGRSCRRLILIPGAAVEGKRPCRHSAASMTRFLRAALALVAGITCAMPACADVDYGTFGAWKVYSDVSGPRPQCNIIPSNEQTSIPAAFFLVGPAWPGSVILTITPLDSSLGLKDGQNVQAFSTFDTGERRAANLTVIWSGRAMMNTAPFSDLLTMAGLHLLSWRIDAPEAHLENLMIPLDGFVSAVNALARCGAAIGAP
jgi:hypothetical protein